MSQGQPSSSRSRLPLLTSVTGIDREVQMVAITASDTCRDDGLVMLGDRVMVLGRVLDWVRDQGLDPEHVRSFRTFGPLVRARVYVLNERGNKQIDPQSRPTNPQALTRVRWLRRKASEVKL